MEPVSVPVTSGGWRCVRYLSWCHYSVCRVFFSPSTPWCSAAQAPRSHPSGSSRPAAAPGQASASLRAGGPGSLRQGRLCPLHRRGRGSATRRLWSTQRCQSLASVARFWSRPVRPASVAPACRCDGGTIHGGSPLAALSASMGMSRARHGLGMKQTSCGSLVKPSEPSEAPDVTMMLSWAPLHINSRPLAQTPQAPWPRIHRLPSASATLAWSSCTSLAMFPAAGEHTAKRAVEAAPEEVDPAHPPDPQT